MSEFDQTIVAVHRWETTLNSGRRAYEEKEYTKAEELLKAAISQASQLSPHDPRIGKIKRALGDLYFDQKKFKKAEANYRDVIKSWEPVFGESYDGLAPVYGNYAKTLDSLDRKDEAKSYSEKAARIRASSESSK